MVVVDVERREKERKYAKGAGRRQEFWQFKTSDNGMRTGYNNRKFGLERTARELGKRKSGTLITWNTWTQPAGHSLVIGKCAGK